MRTSLKVLQRQNALVGRYVILTGRLMDASPESQNTPSPSSVTELGIVIPTILVQPINAYSPILVTLEGISILTREL